MLKIKFRKFKISIIFAIIIVSSFFGSNKSEAAVVTCQKPANVVIAVDNSDSISSYVDQAKLATQGKTPAEIADEVAREAQEWPSLIQFVKAFTDGFTVSPTLTHTSIVLFDGLSPGDITNYCLGSSPSCTYPGHKQVPGMASLPDLGDIRYSDEVIELVSDPLALSNPINGGVIKKLTDNRSSKPLAKDTIPCGAAWYREPGEYFPIKKFSAPNDYNENDSSGCLIDGFKQGGTDWGAGLARSYKILQDDVTRFNDPDVEKIIILLSDGQPSDYTPGLQYDEAPILVSTDAKNNGVKIFAVMIGLDSMCTGGGLCQAAKDLAEDWTEAVSSGPGYNFTVNDFASFETVANSIINFTCGVEGLNINGFVLTNGTVETDRAVSINDYYSYLRNNYLDIILRGLSIGRHFVTFD